MKRSGTGQVPAVRIEAANEWAWCGDRRLALMPKTFAVLRHLVDHAGRLVTKDELLGAVWRDVVVSDAALTSCIRDLRRALEDSPTAPRYIETVHRRGFRFIGPIAGPEPRGVLRAGGDARHEPGTTPATSTLVGREGSAAGCSPRRDRRTRASRSCETAWRRSGARARRSASRPS